VQPRSRVPGRSQSVRRPGGVAVALGLWSASMALGLAGCHILGFAQVPCTSNSHCPNGFGCATAEGVCVSLTDLEPDQSPDQQPEGLPPEACEAPTPVDDDAVLTGGLATPLAVGSPMTRGFAFAAALADGNAGDVITFPRGADLGGRYAHADTTQGTIIVWVTPAVELTELPDDRYGLFAIGPFAVSAAPEGETLIIETRDGTVFELDEGLGAWEAGVAMPLVIRWDTQRPVGIDTYLHVVAGDEEFRVAETPWADAAPAELQVIGGTSAECRRPAPAMLSGLTVYRRPLYDDLFGVDFHRGNELQRIVGNYGNLTGPERDPVDVTGPWDVVFAAPTDRLSPLIDDDNPDAWSHPAGDDLLNGIGDFSTEDIAVWQVENATVEAADPSEVTYRNGMVVTPTDPLGGAYIDMDVTPGDRLVVRAVANAAPESGPELMLFDPETLIELTRTTGPDTWTTDAPGELILTYEVPDGIGRVQLWLREAYANNASSVVWHHVEVLENLVPNPSAVDIAYDNAVQGDLPRGWSADCCFGGASTEETFNSNSTPTSIRINASEGQRNHFRIEPEGQEDFEMYAVGYMAAYEGGEQPPALSVSNGSLFRHGAGLDNGSQNKLSIRGLDVGGWQHVTAVGWRLNNSQYNNHNDFWRPGGTNNDAINVVIDDVYTFPLDDVLLTPVLTDDVVAIRGPEQYALPPGRRLELPFTVPAAEGRITVTAGWRDPVAPTCVRDTSWPLLRLEQNDFNYIELTLVTTPNLSRARFLVTGSANGNFANGALRMLSMGEGELGEFEIDWSAPGTVRIRHGGEESEMSNFQSFGSDEPLKLVAGGFSDDDAPCTVLLPLDGYAVDEN
jgi:hypothetical protein